MLQFRNFFGGIEKAAVVSGPGFILQTTRAGRLPVNALFAHEGAAFAQTMKAAESGEFERVVLLHNDGARRQVLFDTAQGGAVAAAGPTARALPANWARRATWLAVGGLILAVLLFAAERALTP